MNEDTINSLCSCRFKPEKNRFNSCAANYILRSDVLNEVFVMNQTLKSLWWTTSKRLILKTLHSVPTQKFLAILLNFLKQPTALIAFFKCKWTLDSFTKVTVILLFFSFSVTYCERHLSHSSPVFYLVQFLLCLQSWTYLGTLQYFREVWIHHK